MRKTSYEKTKKKFPMSRVWKYARQHPLLAWGTFACAVGTTLFGFVYPSVAGRIIDEVIVPQKPTLLLPYVVMVVAAFILRDLLNAFRILLNNAFEQKVILKIRQDLYDSIQKLPLRWFDNHSSGDLMTRVGEDVQSVERVLIDGIEQGTVAVLQLLGVGIYLFYLNPQLTLLALIPIPLLFAGALWYTLTAHERYRIQRKASSAMQSLLLDNLQGIRQIKSFSREKEESKHFNQVAEKLRDATLLVMRYWATYSPSMSFIGSLGYITVLWFGGQDALTHAQFTTGQLVSFLLFVQMFYEPIGRLHQLNQIYQSGRAAGERVFEILDSPQENYAPTEQISIPPRVRGEIEFQNISFEYRDSLPVLHEINLKVESGQTIAIVGPTGAGKSTLVNLIPRFYEPTSGVITLDGIPTSKISLSSLREQIGIVSQENFLFNTTVLDNLKFGFPHASQEEVEAAAKKAHAHDFIMKLPQKYETIVGERGVKLSGGERQRLSIARAILKNPPILILDEATASVDTETEQLIQEALKLLLHNRTAFIIAHRLSTVQNADRLLVIHEGKIVEDGNHQALLSQKGLYSRLCEAQVSSLLRENA
ncbi:MAG: ABC transporter ATP-binding protein [Verrucomicrobiota bacterium]